MCVFTQSKGITMLVFIKETIREAGIKYLFGFIFWSGNYRVCLIFFFIAKSVCSKIVHDKNCLTNRGVNPLKSSWILFDLIVKKKFL